MKRSWGHGVVVRTDSMAWAGPEKQHFGWKDMSADKKVTVKVYKGNTRAKAKPPPFHECFWDPCSRGAPCLGAVSVRDLITMGSPVWPLGWSTWQPLPPSPSHGTSPGPYTSFFQVHFSLCCSTREGRGREGRGIPCAQEGCKLWRHLIQAHTQVGFNRTFSCFFCLLSDFDFTSF